VGPPAFRDPPLIGKSHLGKGAWLTSVDHTHAVPYRVPIRACGPGPTLQCMSWSIAGDPRYVALAHHQAVSWLWPLLSDGDQPRQVLVEISDSAMDRDREALSERVDLARRTSGRSEVERVLDWPDPPAEIKVDCESVQHFGSDPGPHLDP
jgi:hypothetical protein